MMRGFSRITFPYRLAPRNGGCHCYVLHCNEKAFSEERRDDVVLVKDVARRAADDVLNEYWDGRLPVDPVRIAETLGMSVWSADLPDNESGRIVKQHGQPAQIYLNRNEPDGRQNFTCAHELGHWFERKAQSDEEYSFVDRRDDRPKDAHEWYAEHFAANLLMPAKEFIQACDEGSGVRDLMQRFAVSPAAVRSRMRNLGLA
jgi:hypothetical protein